MVAGAQTTNADIRLMSALDAGPKAAEAVRASQSWACCGTERR